MCKEVNVKESEWSECKSFLHSWQVKIQTWMLDSPAQVTSRSSIISSLAVCLREMPFSIVTRNIAVFTFHSTWPHQAEVGSDPASPSLWKVKIVAGLDGRVVIERWRKGKLKLYVCWLGSVWNGQDFSPTSWRGSEAQPGMKTVQEVLFSLHCLTW